jgi:hypothetical protein
MFHRALALKSSCARAVLDRNDTYTHTRCRCVLHETTACCLVMSLLKMSSQEANSPSARSPPRRMNTSASTNHHSTQEERVTEHHPPASGKVGPWHRYACISLPWMQRCAGGQGVTNLSKVDVCPNRQNTKTSCQKGCRHATQSAQSINMSHDTV